LGVRPIAAVITLSLLVLPVYFWNLNDLGLFNTQESIRVSVAREMQRAGEWIVPLRRGEVYIAKPPMVYWCQIGLANLRGTAVGEFELRLNAALWGWLGVIATYFAARNMLGSRIGCDETTAPHPGTRWFDPAFWSAVALAVGVLYSQSARVGELDVMLVAPVASAIAWLNASWRHMLRTGRVSWLCAAGATAAACVAAAVKGPAGLMVIALGGSVPTLVHAALSRSQPRLGGQPVGRAWWVFKQLESTHPLLVLGVPLGLLWAWLREARLRVGDEKFADLVGFEATDNLNWLDWGGMVRYAEAVAIALGGFLPFVVLGLWIIWRERSRLTPGRTAAACWFVLGLIGFAVSTKGVGRYLTPIWPGMAVLAGIGVAWLGARERYKARLLLVLVAITLVQGAALTWWHAFGRSGAWAARSPRDFMAEVLASCNASRLGTLGFNADALDFYAGRPVDIWGIGRFAKPVEELAALLRDEARSGSAMTPYTLLVLEENHANRILFGSAREDLQSVGLTWEEVPMRLEYRRPPGNARVLVWRVGPVDAE